jgi:hypothetical protein
MESIVVNLCVTVNDLPSLVSTDSKIAHARAVSQRAWHLHVKFTCDSWDAQPVRFLHVLPRRDTSVISYTGQPD